jgi:hypothetical protein
MLVCACSRCRDDISELAARVGIALAMVEAYLSFSKADIKLHYVHHLLQNIVTHGGHAR